MLRYVIHMCTKTCTAGTDSRIFALRIRDYEDLPPAGTDSRTRAIMHKASPRSGRFTEVDGCSTIFFMMTQRFPLLLDFLRCNSRNR